MSAVVTVIVIVAAVALIAAAVFLVTRRAGGGGLERRFGPEYQRTVARYDGDTKAAERDLEERVKRHGSLDPKPLAGGERERYEARWTNAQERFVESPQEAIAEVDLLIAELAAERGYPGRERYEEQLDALSVHHAHHVHGYRRVHSAAHGTGDAGTEALREAMVEGRALFHDLLGAGHDGRGRDGRTERGSRADRASRPDDRHGAERGSEPDSRSSRGRTGPAAIFNRQRTKES
ncbi:hypothetical protein H9Y04_08145 [Streptomyces sp. TRM66268-LWL]|uniref:Secreted protein n=1 Tax=Streptomyces polyasparticus TaxID=2767826 RepID=A0ABR7SD67_9ACTN|nr:hypothetical protein [Streptomyces polyasparticus]MBC9712542.1 hypothetical protein [Streptomyces polyasparticus]